MKLTVNINFDVSTTKISINENYYYYLLIEFKYLDRYRFIN